MASVRGSCLCGDVAWEAATPLEMITHCHCARCRKTHGTAFATVGMCPETDFRLLSGRDRIVRFKSSPGVFRSFCGQCGSVVPDLAWEGLVPVPTGPLDDDPVGRPIAHIFVSSRAPWFEIRDDLPQFEEYPQGVGPAVLPELPPRDPAAGRPRGSCLCGAVGFVLEGEPTRAYACHCSRCRKARSAAHATNLFTTADGIRFTRGGDQLVAYKLPGARFFTQTFCRTCGSPMPRISPEREIAVVPMGSLDDDPGIRLQRHIYVGSKAPWYEIPDELPQHPEAPPDVPAARPAK